MDSKSLFVYGLMATGALMGVDADLRMASQPRNNYVVRQRNAVQFVSKTALYMEPSAFEYKGLEAQRQNAYDNFLRSNIDNEQDKRDFHREAGRDMLPVRTFEAAETSSAATPASAQSQTKLPAGLAGTITATPGQAVIVPLRWNNPHAAELEVNVWINDMKVVVPVKKPTCAGEGHQDAVFEFTIPADWNTAVPAAVPSFKGCTQVGDCVLQIYAHSVEPRQYAIGTPLIITGTLGPAGATEKLAPAGVDPGTDISKQPNDICLSSASESANIVNAVPRAARLISDQANHAYQNNNYSPYSGQQPEAISKNLQASVIISMIPANRGELGRALLQDTNPAGAAFAANLRTKEQNLVKQYEGIVNNIIAKIGNANMKNTATVGDNNEQKLATTFRAAEVGSVTTTRLTTNTYVPSFLLPANQVAAARALVPAKYAGLIDAAGQVKIYEAVLNDLKAEFNKAKTLGLDYLGPVIKDTTTTLADATQFKKLNAAGGRDKGSQYATQQYNKAQAARLAAAKAAAAFTVTTTPLQKALEADSLDFSSAEFDTQTDAQQDFTDPDQMYSDCATDSDADTTATDCKPYQLYTQSADDSGTLVINTPPTTSPSSSSSSSNSNAATTTVASSIIAVACSAIAAIFLA